MRPILAKSSVMGTERKKNSSTLGAIFTVFCIAVPRGHFISGVIWFGGIYLPAGAAGLATYVSVVDYGG